MVAGHINFKEKTIKWNKGGVAVSGEVTLMGMISDTVGIYVTISSPSYHGIMYRTIKHMKDFTGGTNHWAREKTTPEELAKNIMRLYDYKTKETDDQEGITRRSEASSGHALTC